MGPGTNALCNCYFLRNDNPAPASTRLRQLGREARDATGPPPASRLLKHSTENILNPRTEQPVLLFGVACTTSLIEQTGTNDGCKRIHFEPKRRANVSTTRTPEPRPSA